MRDINQQKEAIKKEGLYVDGEKFGITFKGKNQCKNDAFIKINSSKCLKPFIMLIVTSVFPKAWEVGRYPKWESRYTWSGYEVIKR